MASLSQIAQHAQVSKSTVSLVLNNRPHVSRQMRERVLKAVAELNPGRVSPRNGSRTNANVLLIHPLSMGSHQVFRELLQGVRSAVIDEAHGQLTLAAHDPPLRPDHATSALLHDPALRPDGVIVMAAEEEDPIIAEALGEGLPCVLLARQHGPVGTSVVGMDNTAGARAAVAHLIERGHRRIAFIGGDAAFDYTDLRIAGYRDAMEEAGLMPRCILGEGDSATRELVETGPTATSFPTALLYVNDEHAARGLPILQSAGLRVPKDISVIGFDDSDNAVMCQPQLTSVRVPRYLIGRLAGRTVLDHIQYREFEHATVLLRTELVIRESVADAER
ncbi:MAG: LacI family transcriptional regulator [Planctomycetaceae bacterium]|nr:MAG: LacI family transcriptional regulator [Planctomycetaceae bacterium]